jgi:hypothetical protein
MNLPYYDRDGQIISMERFGQLHVDPNYKVVAKKRFKGYIEVSTVWLGLDHNFGRGELAIFESMIFAPESYPYDQAQMRYATLEEAQRGHDRTCADVEAGRRPWFLFSDE